MWQLAERYAPSPHWFLTVSCQLFEAGGAAVDPALAHALMRLVAEQVQCFGSVSFLGC